MKVIVAMTVMTQRHGQFGPLAQASRGGEKKKRTKFKESLKTMVQRVKEFVKVSLTSSSIIVCHVITFLKPGTPRNKEESMKNLKTQFILAQTPGATNKVKTHRTNTGLKDTFQTYFIDRLLDAGKRRRGNVDPKTVVNQLVETFPSETMSPVWRIRGICEYKLSNRLYLMVLQVWILMQIHRLKFYM